MENITTISKATELNSEQAQTIKKNILGNVSSLMENIGELDKHHTALQKKVNATQLELLTAQTNLTKLNEKKGKTEQKHKELNSKLRSLTDEHSKLTTETSHLKGNITAAKKQFEEHTSANKKLTSENNDLQKQIKSNTQYRDKTTSVEKNYKKLPVIFSALNNAANSDSPDEFQNRLDRISSIMTARNLGATPQNMTSIERAQNYLTNNTAPYLKQQVHDSGLSLFSMGIMFAINLFIIKTNNSNKNENKKDSSDKKQSATTQDTTTTTVEIPQHVPEENVKQQPQTTAPPTPVI